MPPSTIVAPDVATRVCWQRLCSERTTASFVALPTIENAPSPASGPRLPSNRPIDHRWDRSRGIIFGNHERKLSRDNTWTPNRSIVFAQPQNPSRSYASRKIGVSYAQDEHLPGVAGISKNQSGNLINPYQISLDAFVASHENVKNLNGNIGALQKNIETLKTEYGDLLHEKNSQEETLRRLQGRLDEMGNRLHFLSTENTRLDRDGADAKIQISHLAQGKVDLTAASASALADSVTAREELEIFREVTTPIRYKKDAILMETRRHAKQESESRLLTQIEQLNTELEREQKARQDINARLQNVQSAYDTDMLRRGTELQDQRASLNLQRKHNVALQAELDGRRNRKTDGRTVYALYRLMFDEFHKAAGEVQGRVKTVQEHYQLEQDLWKQALRSYQESKIHRQLLFKYPTVAGGILTFLNGNASSHLNMDALTENRTQLGKSITSFNLTTHASRSLTRFFHMEETRPMYAAQDLSHDILAKLHFFEQFNALDEEIEATQEKLRGARPAARQNLYVALDALTYRKKMMQKVGGYLKRASELRILQEVLVDDLTEKNIYLKTHRIRERIEEATLVYGKQIHSKDEWAEYRSNLTKAWTALSEYISVVRREIHLAQELDLLRDEERNVDDIIKSHINRAERYLLSVFTSKARPMEHKKVSCPSTSTTTARGLTDEDEPLDSRESGEAAARGRNESRSDLRNTHRHTDRWRSKQVVARASSPLPRHLNIRPTRALQACQPHLPTDYADGYAAAVDVKWTTQSVYPCEHMGIENKTVNAMVCMPANRPKPVAASPEVSPSSEPPTRTDVTVACIKSADSPNDMEHFKLDYGDAREVNRGVLETKLSYHIQPQDFRAAAMASPSTTGAYWNYKLYKNSDGVSPAVYYCTNAEIAEERLKLFSEEAILGFDLEWDPAVRGQDGTIKSCVSLVQVACEDKIGLFHIARFSGDSVTELLPPTLKKILESPTIIKAGVNISGDATRMRKWLEVNMQGVFELSHLFRIVKFSETKPQNVHFRPISLADQVQEVLMLPLQKDRVRTSRWSKFLNGEQCQYAAIDAYAGFRLFHQLDSERELMRPTPPRPAFLEQGRPLVLGDGTEIVRKQRRTVVSKKRTTEEEVEEVEGDADGEEFFDAAESLDNVDPAFAEPVNYPDLEAVAIDGFPLPERNLSIEAETDVPRDAEIAPDSREAGTGSTQTFHQRTTPSIEKADSWAANWRASQPPKYIVKASHRMLQVYHLWHWQHMSLQQVANHCREPPLALTTVARYILTVITDEDLPYDSNNVREALRIMPSSVHRRYQRIVDRIED